MFSTLIKVQTLQRCSSTCVFLPERMCSARIWSYASAIDRRGFSGWGRAGPGHSCPATALRLTAAPRTRSLHQWELDINTAGIYTDIVSWPACASVLHSGDGISKNPSLSLVIGMKGFSDHQPSTGEFNILGWAMINLCRIFFPQGINSEVNSENFKCCCFTWRVCPPSRASIH